MLCCILWKENSVGRLDAHWIYLWMTFNCILKFILFISKYPFSHSLSLDVAIYRMYKYRMNVYDLLFWYFFFYCFPLQRTYHISINENAFTIFVKYFPFLCKEKLFSLRNLIFSNLKFTKSKVIRSSIFRLFLKSDYYFISFFQVLYRVSRMSID